MREINNIIKTYEKAKLNNTKVALATVVNVEGSSYRQPGARMLVSEDGWITGAISGGCLEGDALKKALLCIADNQSKIVTYDTTDDDDAKFGVQLGCNGIIHVLFEPIAFDDKKNAIEILKKAVAKRENAILITVYSLKNKQHQIGTCWFKQNEFNLSTQGLDNNPTLKTNIQEAIQKAESENKSNTFDCEVDGITHSVFVEFRTPPIQLIIGGAGNDAQPLASMSDLLGWDTVVIDGRTNYATTERFPSCALKISQPEKAFDNLTIDNHTAVVLMSHNYNYDLDMMKYLVFSTCRYIGILGPKKKLIKMYDELAEKGIDLTDAQKERIYSPIGFDIGAETSEEIALSIMAEIQAFMMNKNGSPLRIKSETIHA